MRAGRILVGVAVVAGLLAVAPTGQAVVVEYEEFVPVQVAVGQVHTCALSSTGAVKCWGSNASGELGLGDRANRGDGPGEMGADLPFVDLGGGSVTRVAAGGGHTCALLESGSVKCWGLNGSGQLGLGDNVNRGDGPGEMGTALPAVDLGGEVATQVSAGRSHTCALLASSSVKCWGDNQYGQLGLGDKVNRGDGPGEMGTALLAVDLGGPAVAIGAGGEHTCALLLSGELKCWGFNSYGELGLGDGSARGDQAGEMGAALPSVDLGGDTVAGLSVGRRHTCVMLASDAMKCWGANDFGELGLGDTGSRGDEPGEMGDALPAVDLGGGAVVSVAAGIYSTCALLSSGDVKCWGFNEGGTLGLGDLESRGDAPGEMGTNLPALDLGAGAADSLVFSGDHGCAMSALGLLRCWGSNWSGQLGLGDQETRGDEPGEMGQELPPVDLGWLWSGTSELLADPVTLRVETVSGSPVVGGVVSWESYDGSVGSGVPRATDAAGEVRFLMVDGPVDVSVEGGSVAVDGVGLVSGSASVFVAGSPTRVVLPNPPGLAERRVEVVLPDGAPVSEATVTIQDALVAGQARSGLRMQATYEATGFTSPASTDGDGVAQLFGFAVAGSPGTADVKVVFNDGELRQMKAGSFDDSGLARVVLGFMPAVALESSGEVMVPDGAVVQVVASAVDDAGAPLAGRTLALEGTSGRSSTAGSVRGSCMPKLTGVTGPDGRVTLRLCATASGIWHVDGASLVPSAPVRVTVPVCWGLPATKVGTKEADTIYGTAGADVIVGLAGDDFIYGRGGDDRICGGLGRDEIYGGLGVDRLRGDGGRDRLFGEGGDDWLVGGPGVDRAIGGLGTDTCVAENLRFCEL